jgi:hypothetical protein
MGEEFEQSRLKVLVIHALRPSSRQTTIDHLLSFRDHLPHADVQYLHFQQPLLDEFAQIAPDLLIVNYDFLNYRFTPLWPYIKNRHRRIAHQSGKVVAIAQDDFWANQLLDEWCIDWDIDRILTPIETNLDVLYPKSIKKIEFRTALTGYVKSGPVPITPSLRERPIDLGQRVRQMSPHLGRIGQAKARQATLFGDAARHAGFKVDVSTRIEDSFVGDDWFKFLTMCRFTVGMKGGASMNDPKGIIYTKVQSYRSRYPFATFDEIESKCFRGKDMKYEFTAISPRLFESSRAGTCQILQRDDYLGVLEPWRDYLPLEKDMSNSTEILDAMRDLERCQEIVRNARVALVDSGLFDYRHLVELATKGLVEKGSDYNNRWHSFTNYLKSSQTIFDQLGSALHDSIQHLIAEKHGVRVDESQEIESREILSVLRRLHLEKSYWAMLEHYRQDSLSIRAPWIWRPLPSRNLQINSTPSPKERVITQTACER